MGKVVKKNMWPLYESQNETNIIMYSAAHGNPLSCIEPGVVREGDIVIKLPPFTGQVRVVSVALPGRASGVSLLPMRSQSLRPQVEVRMSFGDTKIELIAIDKTTGEMQSTSVEFAKKY